MKIAVRTAAFLPLVLAASCGDPPGDSTAEESAAAMAPAELDPCSLLLAANPSEALGGPVDEPSLVSVQCSVSAKNDYMKSASLALPLASNAAGGMTRERFLELQGSGLEMLGVSPADVRELDGLGELAVYADHELGMQLWVFWGGERSAIINLNGVDAGAGLEWAKALAQSVIDAS